MRSHDVRRCCYLSHECAYVLYIVYTLQCVHNVLPQKSNDLFICLFICIHCIYKHTQQPQKIQNSWKPGNHGKTSSTPSWKCANLPFWGLLFHSIPFHSITSIIHLSLEKVGYTVIHSSISIERQKDRMYNFLSSIHSIFPSKVGYIFHFLSREFPTARLLMRHLLGFGALLRHSQSPTGLSG